MTALPARQIHLDFHTSEAIPAIGARFDKDQWQEALRVGRVNWINIFAKCHHGWSYYPTTAGDMHPHLDFDLLGAQLEACHEMGVRAPIYYTVGWNVHDAETHPEWCVHRKDGTIDAINWDYDAAPEDRRPGTSWQYMCPSGGYLELMLEQTTELCKLYDVDGLWYDITNGPICYCETCRAGMAKENIDIDNLDAVIGYNTRKWQHYMAECNRTVHSYFPDATVYHNGTTVLYADPVIRDVTSRMFDWNTQQELEDLPSTWGGYDKLPLRAKFFYNTGKPMLAMSGKFHTSWGEFGGFKHPDALRYEAASMVAWGAACNFGDQLHPSGEMDMATYRNIGQAFEYVEQIEDYGVGAAPVADLGIWRSGSEADDEGVALMLLESQTDFNVVDPDRDLDPYSAIILTGAACLSLDEADKINAYVDGGGSLLVLGKSALDEDEQAFLIDVGANFVGPANYDTDYLVAGDALIEGLVASPFFNYEAAVRVEPDADAEVLATIHEPYFDRTYTTWCSHLNTPNRLEAAAHPGGLRSGNVVYLPHRLGAIYHGHGARLHRDFFTNALALIYDDPNIDVTLPSAGRVTLLHQPEKKRYVAHLLYGPALKRGRVMVIEDLVPLYDIDVTVRLPEEICGAYLAPQGDPIEIARSEDKVSVTVPKVQCHQAVVFEY